MNPQFLTPDVLRLIVRKAMVPLAMLLVVGGAIYYLNDEVAQDNAQLRFAIDATEWDINETNERIATIDQELGVIREKGWRYDEILLTGFSGPQDRLAANQLIDELSRAHELVTLNYSFEPETVSELHGESGVDFALSQTEISLEISAYTDDDINGFVAEFVRRLKGQVQLGSFSVVRKDAITDDMIANIAAGAAGGAFFGTVRLKWNNVSTTGPQVEEEQ